MLITTALIIKIRMITDQVVKIKMIKKIVDYENDDDQKDCMKR